MSPTPTSTAAPQHQPPITHPSHPSTITRLETSGPPDLSLSSNRLPCHLHTPYMPVASRSPSLLPRELSFLPFQVSAQLPPKVPLLYAILMIHIAPMAARTIRQLRLRAQSVYSYLHPIQQAPIHPTSRTRTMANCPLPAWSHLGRYCEAWPMSH